MLWLWVIGLYIIQALGLTILALRDASRPVRALAWVIIGLLLPLLGLCVYYILAQPLRVRRANRTRRKKQPSASHLNIQSEPSRQIASIVHAMTGTSPEAAAMRVFPDGRAKYAALLHALKTATHTIDMEYYIFRDDHIGKKIVDVLCAKADAGVHVRFLRDGIGSRQLTKETMEKLHQHGIHCRTFFPFQFPWLTPKLNHRDHCKIVIIDKEQAFVGGINIGDEYTGRKPTVGPWRDTHLQVRGQVAVSQLQHVFEMNWNIATPEKERMWQTTTRRAVHRKARIAYDLRPRFAAARLATSGEWASELSAQEPNRATEAAAFGWREGYVQTVESGPDSKIESIRNLFFACITQAAKRIDITTPYFVPDTDILTAIRSAVFKGVEVRLVIPMQPDHKAVGYASRTFYEELLDVGVEVYLYEGAVLHAKVMTVDGVLSVVGAANYDLRSFRLNYEVCQVLYSRTLAEQLTAQFEDDIRHSTRLTREWLRNRNAWTVGKERMARLLAPLL